MLLYMRDTFPDVEHIATTNAASNAAMLSINERLGFKVYKHNTMYKIPIDELATKLGIWQLQSGAMIFLRARLHDLTDSRESRNTLQNIGILNSVTCFNMMLESIQNPEHHFPVLILYHEMVKQFAN